MATSRNPQSRVDWNLIEAYVDAALAVARDASQFEPGSQQGARKVRDAANAFQSITKLRDKVELSASENEEFESKIANLRELLEKLGEWF